MTPTRLTVVPILAAFMLAVVGPVAALSHTVKKGDTLWVISKKYKISVGSIAKANGLHENSTLKIGARLSIPTSGVKPPNALKSQALQKHATPVPNFIGKTTPKNGVVLEDVPLRSEPAASGKKIASISAGEHIRVFGSKWHWLQIKTTSGKQGWVGDYLVKVSAPPPPKAVRTAHNITHHYKGKSSGHTKSKSVSSHTPTEGAKPGAVQVAYNNLGSRYRYGGTSRGGFDCSGFTRYVYSKQGVSLPHSSSQQFKHGTPVPKSQLKPGDLVFFSRGGRSVGHVGVYVGGGKFIHASNPRGGVKVSNLDTYSGKYKGARRVK